MPTPDLVAEICVWKNMMKRFLFAFMCGLFIITLNAQDFDERDLIGKWETVDSIGSFRCNLSSYCCPNENIEYLELYEFRRNGDDSCGVVKCSVYKETYHWDDEMGEVYDGWNLVPVYGHINLWFISNTDKLHLVCGQRADLRYVIKRLDFDNLVLETFDGKGQLTMRRIKESESNISSISTGKQSEGTFTMEGIKVESLTPGRVYISSERKFVVSSPND